MRLIQPAIVIDVDLRRHVRESGSDEQDEALAVLDRKAAVKLLERVCGQLNTDGEVATEYDMSDVADRRRRGQASGFGERLGLRADEVLIAPSASGAVHAGQPDRPDRVLARPGTAAAGAKGFELAPDALLLGGWKWSPNSFCQAAADFVGSVSW